MVIQVVTTSQISSSLATQTETPVALLGRKLVDRDAQAIRGRPDRSMITDLRSIPLGQLAERDVDAEGTVAASVQRILGDAENSVRVRALTFNSAI
jgi:hypothetical protein